MRSEWIILADSAEIVNGKLYVLGGGWQRLSVAKGFPATHRCALSMAVEVPWSDTNVRHEFQVVMQDEDGQEEPMGVKGHFEVGRAAGLTPGQAQRVQIASGLTLNIRAAGLYRLVLRIDGEDTAYAPFTALEGRGQRNRTQ
jgi:hypothetical protein